MSGLDVQVIRRCDGNCAIVVGDQIVWTGWPGEAARLAQMLDDAADAAMNGDPI